MAIHNIVQAWLQRYGKKPHLAWFQWKGQSKVIYGEQQLHMYIKCPLCLYTFVHWNHLCCPHSFSLASCWTGAVSRDAQGWGCIIDWNVSFWSPGTYEHFRSIHDNRAQSCAVGQMTLHQMAGTKQPAVAHPIASYCSSPVLFVKGSVVQHFFYAESNCGKCGTSVLHSELH